ncbi:FERM domain-containing protein 5,Band 4.1-like protein 3,Band 4.1-like protein 2,FERM domain-containing protein 3,Band 4.1-like protein 1 [Mytilus coruscus]|uniref:FERM domain-containing protein 5,Band 4.1-like protein 3,Band 4.1-like protein 2,FERM domain-containing protein 3,Band 4.1-like protein 1 n=1 Tax=Mytilus coruscus TaxID=42192 RepID=A0A6J8EL38_MYTCO|nr:FERM domain-containing protein 5,Band 4.1-like protein 3,Band 4.1-like protein 2,FERM domain-containing protein 3,Band 4.1-like protein 1 [Mytilus coruscus]
MFRKNSKKGDPQVEYQCTIRFLDDSEPIQLFFKKDTLGHSLFDQVCAKLNLVEKDYFGLRYVDADKQRHWLDPLKAVYKQLKGVNPTVLCFRVKFYPADPMKLHEEITRYHLFLQLRRDLHHGRLLCSPADANLLATYIVQSEVGDYDPQDHPQGYVTEFKMLPKQNSRQEEQIMELHKTLSGQVPAEAESNFLKKASTLDTYGVDPHQVKDQKGTSLYLGVTHQGIMTFHGSRRTQLYKWPQIKRIIFEGKMFILHVSTTEDEDQDKSKKLTNAYLCTGPTEKQAPVGYKCTTAAASKYLWRCAVEQQLFFTLANSEHPPKVKSGGNIFSRGSKFRFSGRCQQEAYTASEKIDRSEPDLVRTSSLPNYARKLDSRSAIGKFNTIGYGNAIKEDKTKKRYQETPIDVTQKETKEKSSPVTNLAPSPIVVAPMAASEDSSLDEVIEHNKVVQIESEPPKKMNGSVPTHVLETTFDSMPNYEPEQTILEDSINNATGYDESYDTEEDVTKSSLEDQIKDLEDYIIKKDSEPQQPNHVTQQEPVMEETVAPVKSEHNQTAPPSQKENDISPVTAQPANQAVEEKPKSGGVGCCKILFFTLFFIFVTLAVTLIVILNSNIKHPMVSELRQQFKFIDPVRDYITHKVRAILKNLLSKKKQKIKEKEVLMQIDLTNQSVISLGVVHILLLQDFQE